MTKTIGIVVVMIAVSVLLYMGLSMVSSIPEPEVGSDEYEQFQKLSSIMDITYSGYWIVLIIIMAMAIIGALKIGGKI